jgi:hypothetical protein
LPDFGLASSRDEHVLVLAPQEQFTGDTPDTSQTSEYDTQARGMVTGSAALLRAIEKDML